MSAYRLSSLILAAALTGCAADVQTTDDSTKLELEVPKVEMKGTPDFDPSTDHDVEIKTPQTSD